jgi:hypothetical protein
MVTKTDLEKLIVSQGLNKVLDEISEICYEISDHVAENWQDKNLSKAWEAAGRKIANTNYSISNSIGRLP